MKLVKKYDRPWPSRSWIPYVACPLYVFASASGEVGVSVAVSPITTQSAATQLITNFLLHLLKSCDAFIVQQQASAEDERKVLKPYFELAKSSDSGPVMDDAVGMSNERKPRLREASKISGSLSRLVDRISKSVKHPILFITDLGEIAHAGRGWIGNKLETVAVRERRHDRNRRRRRYCNRRRILHETSTHFVYRLIRAVLLDSPAPFHIERVDDPLNLVDRPINALNAVSHGERIIDAKVLHVKRRGSGVQIHVSTTLRNVCHPEYVRR